MKRRLRAAFSCRWALPLALALLAAGCVHPPTGPDALELAAPPQDWAQLEGRRVRISAPLTVSGHYRLARDGELVASFDGRLATPTEVAAPGPDASAVAADNARRSVTISGAALDTGDGTPWHQPAGAPSLRTGSVLTGVEALVERREHGFHLQLLQAPTLQPAPRPAVPEVAGDVRVAVLNLENLFNGDGRGGGFPTARGARTAGELAAQLARLRATVLALEPDIVAAMELENDGYGPDSSIAGLARTLGPDWAFVDAGEGPGGDAIRVALLYRTSALRTVGEAAVLEGGPFGTRSRVPLAQAFQAGDGPAFTVIANHFKSKGCSEAEGPDRDQGDGQGCWNALRTDAAQRLGAWAATDPTGSGSDLVAIVGDLNAYGKEDPVRTLRESGWQDALAGRDDVHTYVYSAQAGRLDHALLSPALADRLRGARVWHSNADEPAAIGYRGAGAGAAQETPWRSSDHDPILLGFDLSGR
ncbi:ExeM/NucH family extracellular endonuclease [Luteimonas dalianensis]